MRRAKAASHGTTYTHTCSNNLGPIVLSKDQVAVNQATRVMLVDAIDSLLPRSGMATEREAANVTSRDGRSKSLTVHMTVTALVPGQGPQQQVLASDLLLLSDLPNSHQSYR